MTVLRVLFVFEPIEVKKAEKSQHRKRGRQNITISRVDYFVLVLACKLFGIISKK